MKLRTEEVRLKNGKTIVITEENWDVSMTLSEERRKSLEDPLEDKRLQYFREEIYPLIFAPASGDVPAMNEAYAMVENSPEEINEWYRAVQRINPIWFEWLQHHDSEQVVFSDESVLYVTDGNIPSGFMRIWDLEHMEPIRDSDTKTQIFQFVFYSKLAACSIGSVPSIDEARLMPTAELDKWYAATNRVNPHWFKAMQDLKTETDAETLKKKARKRGRSASGLPTS